MSDFEAGAETINSTPVTGRCTALKKSADQDGDGEPGRIEIHGTARGARAMDKPTPVIVRVFPE
jgi:hypothetical protein